MESAENTTPRATTALTLSILAIIVAFTSMGLLLYRVFKEQQVAPAPYTVERAPDHFLVKFKPGTPAETIRSLNANNKSQQIDQVPKIGVKILTVAPGKTPEEMAQIYSRNPNVEFAEVDTVAKATLIPNDTYYGYNATPMSKISAPAGWDITTGSSSVTLAVLDTGIDFAHPEFSARTVAGYDFVNSDADPTDDHGHGTLAAGVAAATGNNGIGVAGVNWKTTIMPVKVMDAGGVGYHSVIAKGMVYAADNGARVQSLSLGGPASATLLSGVQYAQGKGCLLVAASGNDGTLIDNYPASYPDVISVGALSGDTIATFSAYGPWLDVCAPGSGIYAPKMGGGYTYFSGTSAATPFVAGLASLMLAVDPARSAAQLSQEITSTATDLGSSGWDQYYGWGRINIAAALAAAGGTSGGGSGGGGSTPPTSTTTPTPTPAPDTLAPTVSITSPMASATVSGTQTIAVTATDDTAVSRVDLLIDGVTVASLSSAPYSLAWNTTKYANGGHTIVARAYDAAGNIGSAQVSVTVSNTTKGRRK